MAKDRLKRLEMNGTKFRYVRFIGGRSGRIPLHTGDLHEALTRRDALDRDFDHKAPSQDWAHKLAAVAQRERREEIFELIAGGATERAIAVERHTPLASIRVCPPRSSWNAWTKFRCDPKPGGLEGEG